METVQGTITKVLFSSEDTGYKVLRVRTKSGSPTVVTGEFGPEMVVNTAASFHGDFRKHPKYGMQFRSFSSDVTFNAEETASIRLFIDNVAPNIGPERSEAIVRHFGSDTIDVLENHPERLLEVDGIGKVSAESLAKAWKDNKEVWDKEREVYSLRAFLNSLGIKERRVKRILSHFGGGIFAEEKIRENPYILTEIEGFGFTTTDYVAKKLGIPESSPERLKAFIEHLLLKVCPDNGHMYLPKKSISVLVNKYATENATQFLGMDIISLSDINPLLAQLIDADKVVIDDDKAYAKKNFNFEARSAQILVNIMKHSSDLIFLNQDAVNKHIDTFEKENGLVLSDEQKQALHLFAEQKVFVITGAPGTGKTTILKALVELAIRMKLHLTCMTPTGISAKKLASTIGFDAYTIHRRLGFRGDSWECNEVYQYDTDVAIIDESSMIDQEVFYRLVSAMKPRTHMVFVGDQDQLPSVGAGNVLKELIHSEAVPVIKLERIFRQAEASDIIKVAHGIKHGETDLELFKPDPKADVFFMRIIDPSEIERVIVALAQRFKDKRKLFQIITPRNDGPLGVEPLNKTLQEILNPPNPTLREINCGPFIIREGDRVIVKKNDYELEVFNGDIGKVISVAGGNVAIEIDNRIVPMKVDDISEKIRLAYSITVHKSQGMEYPYIILPFINQFGKNMLQRNLLYTAITRAKDKVIVLGHGSALEKAILNASVSKRNTILGERIRRCLEMRKRPSSLPSLLEQRESQEDRSVTEPSSSENEKYSPMALPEK